MTMIEVRDLSRQFTVTRKLGRFKYTRECVDAVHSVSFTVNRGEAIGYVGSNGAGKSTTIKMLTGILVPTSGEIRVCGLDPTRKRRELARRIGVVFGQRSQLWWDLPLIESFELLRTIYRVGRSDYAQQLEQCIELLNLQPFIGKPVRQLSLGQRMRGEVTAALLHRPELLVLDEPTIGLDMESKERLLEFLTEINMHRDTTLLLTTHDLNDIHKLCRRMIVLDNGQVLADGDLRELRKQVTPERVLIVDLEQPELSLDDFPGVISSRVEMGGLRHLISFDRDRTTAASLISAVASRASVQDVSVLEPSIEDVVRRLYARAADTSLSRDSQPSGRSIA